jgi:hypothetical protein
VIYLSTTKKALRVLRHDRLPLDPPGTTTSRLGNWLVNVVPLADREMFLFMSTRSLLNFPIFIGKLQPEPADMLTFLHTGVERLTKGLPVPRQAVSRLLEDLNEVAICASADKSAVGVLSGISAEYSHRVAVAHDSRRKVDMDELVRKANETPRATLNWKTSFEATSELLLSAA